MIFGFFSGKTVADVQKQRDKVVKAEAAFRKSKEEALADRYAAVRTIKDEILALEGLGL